MRRSDFQRLVADEFGVAYGAHVRASVHLAGVGGLTADDALAAGRDPRDVWMALCEQQDVPVERRLGKDRPPRR
ncbi:DUF3046 domain-containing protein [Falsarthrobacter nasiphocae]|uniref:DUF3046 domain-containing protein n=1 Tax=Falsarthrobacter nasiphocae TaxID=189863 RepID=A0AAE4C6Z0_9MICC|nr:DUF3046 domain-containing protein [Falsarthrobacter nasiphocae]MDR6892672.1 hypothetical protein [Falsarthrobacter nasiphocae]